jgi:hypothetical protein
VALEMMQGLLSSVKVPHVLLLHVAVMESTSCEQRHKV